MITFTTLHYTQSMKTDILNDLQHLVIFFYENIAELLDC